MTVVITAGAFTLCYWLVRPLGWPLFRFFHRNNPDALAWADREQGRV